jgi:hypothetical protein
VSQCLALHERLFEDPVLSVGLAGSMLGVKFPNASRVVSLLEQLQILRETTGRARNRVYRYDAYYRLFDETPGV